MSLPSTVFIIYQPENIQGGGNDTILRGLFPSLEHAKATAQSLASFNTWLNFPTEFKSLYDKGNHFVYGLQALRIIEVPFSVAINGEFSDFLVLDKSLLTAIILKFKIINSSQNINTNMTAT